MPKRDHGVLAKQWWNSNPTTGPTGTAATWVGGEFFFDAPGRVAGFRFYVGSGDDANWKVIFWRATQNILKAAGAGRIRASTASAGWQQVWIRPWVRIDETEPWRVAVLYPGGRLFRNNSALSSPVDRPPITFARSFQTTSLNPETASITFNTNANAVDVLFYPD